MFQFIFDAANDGIGFRGKSGDQGPVSGALLRRTQKPLREGNDGWVADAAPAQVRKVRIFRIGFDELSHMQRMGGSAMARFIIKNPSKGQIWAENSNC